MSTNFPSFVFAMTPLQPTSFKNFFETGSVGNLIANPGQLRHSGWDLVTNDRPRLVKGDYWEVKSFDRKLIRAFHDGSITVKVAGDNSFLAWGRNDENFLKIPKLNSLAVVEFCLNFSIFCRNAAAILDPRPRTVDIIVGIRNAFFGESKLFIIAAKNHPWDFDHGPKGVAPESDMQKHYVMPVDELFRSDGPSFIAFGLASLIYNWFGVPSESIPYATKIGEKWAITPQTIVSIQS